MPAPTRTAWTFAIAAIAVFMVTLDKFVVTTALPVIREDVHASLGDLEWIVNAYMLTFAVLLLFGAALGDRFGRKRMFEVGLGLFTAGSLAAALAPDAATLIAARGIQGVGGAFVVPLTLTLVSTAVPVEKRGAVLGAMLGIGGLGVAIGPLVGGSIVQGIDWQWIFWLNVPIGLLLVPLAVARLEESHGPTQRLDLPGVGLASAGLVGIVWGLIRGNDIGWTSPEVIAPIAVGVTLFAGFVLWELRAHEPMLRLQLFGKRAFAAVNAVSLLMAFALSGSMFVLTQFLQTAQGYSPLEAGVRTLPWTALPMLTAPVAGKLSDRIGGRPLLFAALVLQAAALVWLAAGVGPGSSYDAIAPPFALAGAASGLFFGTVLNVAVGSVGPEEEGQASGTNNAARELGSVLGVTVLAAVFASRGGYGSPADFVDGLVPALWAGAAAAAGGAVLALALTRRRATSAAVAVPEAA